MRVINKEAPTDVKSADKWLWMVTSNGTSATTLPSQGSGNTVELGMKIRVKGWEGAPWDAIFWIWDDHGNNELTVSVLIHMRPEILCQSKS